MKGLILKGRLLSQNTWSRKKENVWLKGVVSSRRDLEEWRPYCTVRYLGNWLLKSMVKILFKHNGCEDDRENESRA